MPPIPLKADGQPVKVFIFGDLMIASGFGRITNECARRLAIRGWNLVGASLQYGGWPFGNIGFPVAPLGGRDINNMWTSLSQIINTENPDVVIVCQDFPYAVTTYQALRIDWSTKKFITVTPIDGVPIAPDWLDLVDQADATMVISRFGVEAMARSGKQVELLHPGVDINEFYPAEDKAEVAALRKRAGIPENAFVTGSFMMNQGRKMVSKTIEVFGEFAHNKPDAYLVMDMESASPAGWDIKKTMQQLGWPDNLRARVICREDLIKPGVEIMELRERYILCDISSQMAHREGFGLPNLESMACKVPPMVLDWCSGSEIAGGGKGILIRRLDYMEMGTWGGARDAFPDVKDWLSKWNHMYYHRDHVQVAAIAGYEWAKAQTWDNAANQLEDVLRRVVTAQKKERKANDGNIIRNPAPGLADTADSRGNPAPQVPTSDLFGGDPNVHKDDNGAGGASGKPGAGGVKR